MPHPVSVIPSRSARAPGLAPTPASEARTARGLCFPAGMAGSGHKQIRVVSSQPKSPERGTARDLLSWGPLPMAAQADPSALGRPRDDKGRSTSSDFCCLSSRAEVPSAGQRGERPSPARGSEGTAKDLLLHHAVRNRGEQPADASLLPWSPWDRASAFPSPPLGQALGKTGALGVRAKSTPPSESLAGLGFDGNSTAGDSRPIRPGVLASLPFRMTSPPNGSLTLGITRPGPPLGVCGLAARPRSNPPLRTDADFPIEPNGRLPQRRRRPPRAGEAASSSDFLGVHPRSSSSRVEIRPTKQYHNVE